MSRDRRAESRVSRRDLLKGVAATALGSALGPLANAAEGPAPRQSDLIRTENEKPGTLDWRLTNPRVDPKEPVRCRWIEGYCSHTSVRAGERLEIMVSTNPPAAFLLDVYRLGYYGGKGGRHLGRFGPFEGRAQPDPKEGEEHLRECAWEPATTIMVPKDWPSGIYLGKLTAEKEKRQSYVIFIVRDDRACDFLVQCSDSTWLAYNRWPDGWNMYKGKIAWCGPGVRVSWDRPYGLRGAFAMNEYDNPLWQGSGEFLAWEYPLAFWMEKEGYDVSYLSTVDTHADGKGLLRAKGWISVGHDEYWSQEMFRNVTAARDAGVNLAFMSGDTCWGVIPFLPGTTGRPHRVITRIGQFGPIDQRAARTYKGLGKLKPYPTEATLIGARDVFPFSGEADWICADAEHWIFAGTGMKNGDGIPNLVGHEWKGDPADVPGLRVVAKGKVTCGKHEGAYTATVYPGPKSNWVFNAASIWWAAGLSSPPGYVPPTVSGVTPRPDPRAQRITANVFNRFCGRG